MKSDEIKIPVNGANHSGDREEQNNQIKCTHNTPNRQGRFQTAITYKGRWLEIFITKQTSLVMLPAAIVVLIAWGAA
ncbi:MAG: hypothetical protein ACD_35C00111G0001 [uncultured bacterium]|nr:MAG: hypothetical protein ACD_35C00111G0001 [uncultured bacterium]